ncbi:CLUMA_CG001589, isoform A [Clunio marinus]|uniref:CLUMA_CG001589, isoform A n=1 Tax=Clunio marinus TaxID=568069 RepID=A0A1J1HIL3_9DIPT|nr:CLUMA_CG001589, isoform A [Clunio marinus]
MENHKAMPRLKIEIALIVIDFKSEIKGNFRQLHYRKQEYASLDSTILTVHCIVKMTEAKKKTRVSSLTEALSCSDLISQSQINYDTQDLNAMKCLNLRQLLCTRDLRCLIVELLVLLSGKWLGNINRGLVLI